RPSRASQTVKLPTTLADRTRVTTTLSPPIRILALVGVLAAVGLGILLFAHNRSASSSSGATPSLTHVTGVTTGHGKSTAKPSLAPSAKPKVALLPGLPRSVAHALRNSKVVVVVLFAHGAAGDGTAVGQARAGAKSAHSGFLAVNVANEAVARSLGDFG